jgi:hypothetical protein
MRVGQRVPDALAAKDMAALGRDHQPAGVHDLRESERQSKREKQGINAQFLCLNTQKWKMYDFI